MRQFIHHFLIAWIPLFIAMDPLALIPLFVSLTRRLNPLQIKSIARQAIWTAAFVGIGFMILGRWIFIILGIGIADFQISGGIILLILAIREMLSGGDQETWIGEDVGVVPLGTPLIAGPATITTLLILMDSVGIPYTLLALTLNLALVILTFRYSVFIAQKIGITGIKAIVKIIALLLAAIAVSMIRKGLSSQIFNPS